MAKNLNKSSSSLIFLLARTKQLASIKIVDKQTEAVVRLRDYDQSASLIKKKLQCFIRPISIPKQFLASLTWSWRHTPWMLPLKWIYNLRNSNDQKG